MKYLFITALLGLMGCEKKSDEPKQKHSQVQNSSIQQVTEEPKSTVTEGELCDLHDDEERETYRIFLMSDTDGGKVSFFRVNDNEDVAYPGLRTANLDLIYMFKSSESDYFMRVSLHEKIYFKENGIWRNHGEVIKAFSGQYGDKYVLQRTRYLRDKDKFSEKDWDKTSPEPFRISSCRDASIEVHMEWLPRRRDGERLDDTSAVHEE